MVEPKMKVVLVEPEIPFNTGAVGRTCVALDLELILIKPLGFSLDDASVSRAGTRYWKYVNVVVYDNWKHFLKHRLPLSEQLYFFEENGKKSFYAPKYHSEAYLVFGCESKGLSKTILESVSERVFALPMKNKSVKSLNLSNSVTAVAYQALRNYFNH